MSEDSKVPLGDEISQEIRAKVAEANQRQRLLNEALVHAREVLAPLKPKLDEAAAYMHRETGLDVIAGHMAPAYLVDAFVESATRRVQAETREVTVPTVPPTTLHGGFQVEANLDGTFRIRAFWTTGDCQHSEASHCWSEVSEGRISGENRAAAIRAAGEAFLSKRHMAAEYLLDTLKKL
jgi:hypothetical protein